MRPSSEQLDPRCSTTDIPPPQSAATAWRESTVQPRFVVLFTRVHTLYCASDALGDVTLI